MTQIELYNELKNKKLVIQTFLVFNDLQNINPFDVTKNIKKFVMVRNEQPSVKPIYKFNFNLSLDILEKINESKEWYIEIKIFHNKNSGKSFNDTSLNPTKMIIRDLRLKPFEYPVYKNKGSKGDENTTVGFFVECFEETHFNTNNSSVEVRLKDTSVKEALLYIISFYSDTLKIKKLVTNLIDNDHQYNEIQIADGGIFSAIYNLDKVYGIYFGEVNCFIENNTFYCIDRKRINGYKIIENHRNNLLVNLASDDERSNIESIEGNLINVTDGYFIENRNSTSVRTLGAKINTRYENFEEDNGTSIEVINEQDKTMVETIIKGSEKSLYLKNVHNLFEIDRITSLSKNLLDLHISFRNCNMTDHNFNTQYKIHFRIKSDERFNGTWVLRKGTFIAEEDDEGVFSLRYDCILTKIKEG